MKDPWRVRIEELELDVGYFATELEAAQAHDAASWDILGADAILNFPGDFEVSNVSSLL